MYAIIKENIVRDIGQFRQEVFAINQDEMRMHTCCFTGHRPDKMDFEEKEIRPMLEKAIDNAIKNGYVTFITGMAMGTDYGKQIFMQS